MTEDLPGCLIALPRACPLCGLPEAVGAHQQFFTEGAEIWWGCQVPMLTDNPRRLGTITALDYHGGED
jgi:hypothetical protein